MISGAEVAKHNSFHSCWVIIANNVYDVTELVNEHPGGPNSILRWAGQDATEAYEPAHPSGTLLKLPQEKHLGPVDPTTISRVAVDTAETETPAQEQDLMSISVCQNLDDIEAVARRKLSRKAWIYFSSAADSLESLHANRRDWSKITFRPRVLRNVTRARMKRRVMGHDSSLPFFIAPAAMAKLGHPDGEKCLADGAAKANIVYCTSTYSSVAHEELSASFRGQPGGGTMTFQLYVPKQKQDAAKLIEMARKLGCKALVITVDTPVVGRREEDDRYQAELEVQEEKSVPRTFNLNDSEDAPVYRGFHNSTLDWDDIGWLRSLWGAKSGPVYIKGIQTVEDALAASQIGVDGIYLSNHGGRQLDFAPSSIRTLLEIRKFHPEILKMTEIYLDGGVRRGTDIVKALCLGATAVGLGRPFHYALSAFGTDGVLRAIELLSAEIQTTMRLMGVTSLEDLNASFVNAKVLENELVDDLPGSAVLASKL